MAVEQKTIIYDSNTGEILKTQDTQDFLDKSHVKSPFTDFFQFNREQTPTLLGLIRVSPKATELLFFLLDQMDKHNAIVCSYAVIKEALGMSTATITRCIAILKEYGLINVYRSGSSNVYTVNKTVAWSSWGGNYKFGKFSANIILAKSENEDVEQDTSKNIDKKKFDNIKKHFPENELSKFKSSINKKTGNHTSKYETQKVLVGNNNK